MSVWFVSFILMSAFLFHSDANCLSTASRSRLQSATLQHRFFYKLNPPADRGSVVLILGQQEGSEFDLNINVLDKVFKLAFFYLHGLQLIILLDFLQSHDKIRCVKLNNGCNIFHKHFKKRVTFTFLSVWVCVHVESVNWG